MNGVIRYLEQWEKQKTRELYETAFPEDSKEFVDYYYQWKIRDNEIAVMEEKQSMCDSILRVMIHLNPYIIWMNGRQEKIPYLVAVAADPGCRRQGNMRQVMYRLLQDLEQKKVPFTFLLPADPAYYKGQGFVFFPNMDLTGIYKEEPGLVQAAGAPISYAPENLTNYRDQQNNSSAVQERASTAVAGCCRQEIMQSEIVSWLEEKSGIRWQKAAEIDIPEMIRYSNRVLQERHEAVISRDKYYFQRLLAETEVEHGGILLLRHQGNLCGMITYAVHADEMQSPGKYKAEIKELLLEEFVQEEEGREICRNALREAGEDRKIIPEVVFSFEKMMVRIISLMETVPLLRSQRRRFLRVKVKDPVIEANNGCFCITLDWDGGRIERIAEEETVSEMDISALTQELWRDVSVYFNEWV